MITVKIICCCYCCSCCCCCCAVVCFVQSCAPAGNSKRITPAFGFSFRYGFITKFVMFLSLHNAFPLWDTPERWIDVFPLKLISSVVRAIHPTQTPPTPLVDWLETSFWFSCWKRNRISRKTTTKFPISRSDDFWKPLKPRIKNISSMNYKCNNQPIVWKDK